MGAWIEVFDPVLGQWARFPTDLVSRVTAADHGTLAGLADDDHSQYHNDARGDIRYAPIAKGVTNGDTHDHVGGDGAQVDHGGLAGLADDDHAQYHNDARGDARYAPLAKGVTNGDSHDHVGGDGAQIDHGVLAGLADDDHTQYHNDTRGDARYAPIAKGVTNGDTHDHVGGDGNQIDHGGLAGLADDDHTQYTKHSLATAADDFLVASGAGAFVKKTLAETKTILGLGTAASTTYETGTFTPTVIGITSAGAGTYTTQTGRYTKIGNRVYFNIVLIWTAHTGTGGMRVGGLPYTCNAAAHTPVVILPDNLTWTANYMLTALVIASADYINLYQMASGVAAAYVTMDTAGDLYLEGHYEV